jgi:hypothetical protein
MPPGLDQNALACIDQDDGELGVRGSCRHVAGVLFVTRRIHYHERPLRSREETISDVDGYSLFALRFQSVNEQREVNVVAGRAVSDRVLSQRQ